MFYAYQFITANPTFYHWNFPVPDATTKRQAIKLVEKQTGGKVDKSGVVRCQDGTSYDIFKESQ